MHIIEEKKWFTSRNSWLASSAINFPTRLVYGVTSLISMDSRPWQLTHRVDAGWLASFLRAFKQMK
jgi:hypothetical protein